MKKATVKKTGPPSNTPERSDRDRRVRQSERIARVLGVLNLIQSKSRWNARDLARELECCERTIYRDLEVLEFAGVPWFYDQHDECYRVRPDYRFPSLMLTAEETLGQAIATAITRAPGLNIGLGAGPTTRRLAAASNADVQQILADAARLVEVFDLKLVDHSKHSEAIKTIQFALLKTQQVSGNYESPYESKSLKLTIHPYRLCLVKQAWYVVGNIDGEKEVKTFRVARFKSLRALERVASIPDDFDLRAYFGNAWSVYRGDKSYEIELRFEPLAGRIVTETIWHPTQKIKQNKDKTVSLFFKVDGLDEILHWILTWAGKVEVIKPIELRQMFVRNLEVALKMNSLS